MRFSLHSWPSRCCNLFLFLLLLVSGVSQTANAANNENDCVVLNANGDDVTIEVYDESLQMVNCTGENSCQGYQMNYCSSLYCDGTMSCADVTAWNVTSDVHCLDTKACRYAQIHATLETGATTTLSSNANAYCIGKDACDVTSMTNMNQVVCNGSNSCRKARIHASMVQCDKGGQRYESCGSSATFIIKDCLLCGNENGCSHIHSMCRYRLSEEDVPIDYWGSSTFGVDPWESCIPETIVGTCSAEWMTQFEDEGMEEAAHQNSEEEGS